MRLLLNGRGVEVLGKRLKEENHYVATAPNLNSKIGAANAKVVHKPDVVVGELGQGDVAVAFDGLGVKVWGMCSWGVMAYKSEEYWEQLLEVAHSHTIPLLDLQGEVNEAHVEINCGQCGVGIGSTIIMLYWWNMGLWMGELGLIQFPAVSFSQSTPPPQSWSSALVD